MFEEADAKRGPYGVVFVVPSALALRRLREAAPAWRAAGGRRVLGLRAIEAGIERFPDGFVHVDLSERYETHTPGAWEWERPGRRRVRKSPGHHGTFEDDLVGTVTNVEALRPAVEALAGASEDLSTLGRHVEAAVIADDPSQVDLLEEALALHGARFEAWLPVVRARWKTESSGKLSFPDLSAVVRALASGEADPFAAARAYPPEIAAPALERIRRRAAYNMLSRPEQKAFRNALRSSTDPLAAPLPVCSSRSGDARSSRRCRSTTRRSPSGTQSAQQGWIPSRRARSREEWQRGTSLQRPCSSSRLIAPPCSERRRGRSFRTRSPKRRGGPRMWTKASYRRGSAT